jgi:hypothetical protein
LFYDGREAPNMLADYDAIGFDADHCLVQYDEQKFSEHIVSTYLDRLHESFQGYPQRVK